MNNKLSVVDDTFKELDEKFSILNQEAKNWFKMKLIEHISEAYDRGVGNKKKKT